MRGEAEAKGKVAVVETQLEVGPRGGGHLFVVELLPSCLKLFNASDSQEGVVFLNLNFCSTDN